MIGSAVARNRAPAEQSASFEAVDERYSAAIDAFRYGMPPHAGMTLDLDRLIALGKGLATGAEARAFPKLADGQDPLLGAPCDIDVHLLRGLIEEKS